MLAAFSLNDDRHLDRHLNCDLKVFKQSNPYIFSRGSFHGFLKVVQYSILMMCKHLCRQSFSYAIDYSYVHSFFLSKTSVINFVRVECLGTDVHIYLFKKP